MKDSKDSNNRKDDKSNSKNNSKNNSKARLPYGSGYMGLAMAICEGDADLRKRLFGV
jgi:hypothetical protein